VRNLVHQKLENSRLSPWVVAVAVATFFAAALLGAQSSVLLLLAIVAVFGTVLFLVQPVLGLCALVVAALVIRIEFGTGTTVRINTATLLVPGLLAFWVMQMVSRRRITVTTTSANKPLVLFVALGFLSLLVGNATWDPTVPRSDGFLVVQLSQWAIFVFSAGAFWLMANLVRNEVWLYRVTWLFLFLGGSLAILVAVPPTAGLAFTIATIAVRRAPFWLLLTGLAGGQLAFNSRLPLGRRAFLVLVVAAALFYTLVVQRASVSGWMSTLAALGMIAWLRWPRLRWPVLILIVALAVMAGALEKVYDLAGGEAEWQESGGTRLALIGRVVEVTMRNPITGLGPASYRLYGRVDPLPYLNALWLEPNISSHNNYVDLFSHAGLAGLACFVWLATEVMLLAQRLRCRTRSGFALGYINGMLATWVGALILMMFADWILPFVYNIGYAGFQAAVLVWMFLGGLVSLETAEVQCQADGERSDM
jgi:O-antigen ligase